VSAPTPPLALLARFDLAGGPTVFDLGVGLAGGALFDAKEIEQVLERYLFINERGQPFGQWGLDA
jgi:hypothetical protein